MADNLDWLEWTIRYMAVLSALYLFISVLTMHGFLSVFLNGKGIWFKGITVRDLVFFLPSFMDGVFAVLASLPLYILLLFALICVMGITSGLLAGFLFLQPMFKIMGLLSVQKILENLVESQLLQNFLYLILTAGILGIIKQRSLSILIQVFKWTFGIGVLLGMIYPIVLEQSSRSLWDIVFYAIIITFAFPEVGYLVARFYIEHLHFPKIESIILNDTTRLNSLSQKNLFLAAALSDSFLILASDKEETTFQALLIPAGLVELITFAPFQRSIENNRRTWFERLKVWYNRYGCKSPAAEEEP